MPQLPQLQRLHCSGSSGVPSAVWRCSQLTRLVCEGASLPAAAPAAGALGSLQALALLHCPCGPGREALPVVLCPALSGLTRLKISQPVAGVGVQAALPAAISHLSSLRLLHLERVPLGKPGLTALSHLPPSLTSLFLPVCQLPSLAPGRYLRGLRDGWLPPRLGLQDWECVQDRLIFLRNLQHLCLAVDTRDEDDDLEALLDVINERSEVVAWADTDCEFLLELAYDSEEDWPEFQDS
ncbi:hypothetical protein ABPG75_004266 [Micractinium tetrahymenae]